jgi:hypothetical protein
MAANLVAMNSLWHGSFTFYFLTSDILPHKIHCVNKPEAASFFTRMAANWRVEGISHRLTRQTKMHRQSDVSAYSAGSA